MSPVITNLLFKSLAETLYMLSVSAIIAAIIGIPLGILLVVTEKNGILVCPDSISRWHLPSTWSVPFHSSF